MPAKILILGSSGKSGRAILTALSKKSAESIAFIHKPEYEQAVLASGASETFIGDVNELADLTEAMRNVDVVYHICSNMNQFELEIGKKVISACEKSNIERLVFQSVIHPQTQTMKHHWQKLLVEEQLFLSHLDFTVLQPTAFMQNILGYRETILSGRYPMPYPTSTRISLVDLRDVAEAAAIVLTEKGHENATYELTGTLPLSQEEVAESLTSLLDIKVIAEEIPLSSWEKQAQKNGLNGYAFETLKSMFNYYRNYGLKGNEHVLTWLLGRKPTSLQEFLAREFSHY